MDNKVYYVIAFVAGTALGGVSTWLGVRKYYDNKYSEISRQEIASVKERFTVPKEMVEPIKEKKEKEKKEEKSVAKTATNKPSLSEYAKNIKTYINYSDSEAKEEVSSNLKRISFKPNGSITVIEPEEYGEDEEYDRIELTLYADGILADEDDTVINDVEGLLGEGALERMGEYEEDALHVKNEPRKCYYEVLVDNQKYEKATGKTPPDHGEED